jgi:hypothetical protein
MWHWQPRLGRRLRGGPQWGEKIPHSPRPTPLESAEPRYAPAKTREVSRTDLGRGKGNAEMGENGRNARRGEPMGMANPAVATTDSD